MIYGYACAGSDAQDFALQLAVLRAAGCETVIQDQGGSIADRPQLASLLGALRPGDVVKVPGVDRLARDSADLVELGCDIRRAGARLVSVAEPIVDTASEAWDMVAACFGIAARFERRRLSERIAAGRAAARVQGVKFGRRPKLTPHQRQEALRRRDVEGEPHRSIARSYNVSQSTISRLKPDCAT